MENEFVPQPANQSNGISIAALVCGILGIIGAFISIVCYFTLVLAILGIVFGAKGMKKAKSTGTGKGLAIAGLVVALLAQLFRQSALSALFAPPAYLHLQASPEVFNL